MRCTSMRMAGLALIALVAACTGPAGPQAHSPSPAAVSPEPIPTMRSAPIIVQTLGFSCRLPIFVDIGAGQPGAFIDFPSGTVTPDPAATAVASTSRSGRELVDYFSAIHYYDRAYSRWLPVSRKDVSPDGSHYAYTDRAVANSQNPPTRATLHVVDVKTGIDVAFDDGAWSLPYVILDYATEGIYLITEYGAYIGLWLMDPATGAITRVANLLNVQGSAGSNVFWVGTTNPNDPHATGGVAPDQLDRLSLVDGNRFTWFYRPGSAVHFLGEDLGGHPILAASTQDGTTEILLVLAPGIDQTILPSWDVLTTISNPISDSHGTWFGSPGGIYLYTEATGLQRVSTQPGYPANGCL
jgi:hypothetical protein